MDSPPYLVTMVGDSTMMQQHGVACAYLAERSGRRFDPAVRSLFGCFVSQEKDASRAGSRCNRDNLQSPLGRRRRDAGNTIYVPLYSAVEARYVTPRNTGSIEERLRQGRCYLFPASRVDVRPRNTCMPSKWRDAKAKRFWRRAWFVLYLQNQTASRFDQQYGRSDR